MSHVFVKEIKQVLDFFYLKTRKQVYAFMKDQGDQIGRMFAS
jgi:hypothetical protein